MIVAAIGIAIAAPILAPIALAALTITATATSIAIATAVIGLTLSIGASLAFRALGVGAPQAKQQVGPPMVFRQSISDSFIVYGKRRVGGLLVFYHARESGGAHYRYFVIAVAGHEVEGVVSFMLGDEIVTMSGNTVASGKYANSASLYFHRGLSSQSANGILVSETGGKWTADHQGNGIAYIVAKFQLTDKVVEAGMPNITAIIEGRNAIWDTRTSAYGYTRNGALIFYDWMKMAREAGGFGAYSDEIPDDVWISAQANVCDEVVNGAPRYAIDAVLTTGAAPASVRDAFVVNMGGSYTFAEGLHLFRPGYWVAPSVTLSEDDLAGAIQVSPFTTADATANQVQGTFISPDDNYQGKPFPTQEISPAPADIRQLDLDLAFITNPDQAVRVANIMLGRAQLELSVVWPSNISGLKARALDTVQLSPPPGEVGMRYGLNNYAFVEANWSLSPDFGIVHQLREESADIYTDPSPTVPTTPPEIDEPDPMLTLVELQEILRGTYPRGMNATAEDAGATATITIHGTAGMTEQFTLDYPGEAAVLVGPGSISGLAFSTTYYLYCDVDSPADTTPTFGATTSYNQALNSTSNPRRIFLNRSIVTPVDGGAPTSGGGTGGGYGGGTEDAGGLVSYP